MRSNLKKFNFSTENNFPAFLRGYDDTVVRIRAVLTDTIFVDVFYNADTRKCSYTLIKNKKRVFGADNSFIGWHIYPFENPNDHQLAPELSFEEFLSRIELNHYRKLNDLSYPRKRVSIFF